MRYVVSINFNKEQVKSYSFREEEISKFLTKEQTFNPESYIQITTINYEREKAGMIEKNWQEPFYNDQKHFIFIGGYILFRNNLNKENKIPTPKEILDFILKYGDEHYKYLKGLYYVLILDKKKSKATIYSSPMFMHPAYFFYKKDLIVFTNYLSAIKHYFSITIDQQSLLEYLLFDHCIHTRTIYKEVKLIPGGHSIQFENGGVTERLDYDVSYWFNENPIKRKDALDGINNTLKNAIYQYLGHTDTFNISLTGGFDGRLNFSFIEKNLYPRLHAFSYGKKGSMQLIIPERISEKLGFRYKPIILDEEFERYYSNLGLLSIYLTCGITGFNRAVYPYSYNIIKNFSRSCIVGQCDMIRPLYNNPAGVIFNEHSNSIFFSDYYNFKEKVMNFWVKSIVNMDLFNENYLQNIYEEILMRYINPYKHLSNKLRFYFFLLKESLMKYWHTEFHLVDIFVDDYVPFSDLDYLELLFNSEYAGIYKGILAKNQFQRRKGQDLYIDLMRMNNDSLNKFYNDRGFKPEWLKYGTLGWLLSGIAKKFNNFKKRKVTNDTFSPIRWSKIFYQDNFEIINKPSDIFITNEFIKRLKENNNDLENHYRFNRLLSTKIWLNKFIGI